MFAHDVGRKAGQGRPYVDKVLDETQRYAHDLLSENERLRALMTALEGGRTRLDQEEVLLGIERENQALQALLASIEREKTLLQEQILALRDDEARRASEQARLREELASVEERSREFARQFGQIERQNANLANLYVATYQLHGTLDRGQVLACLQEILANLVGSEEIVVLEKAGDGRRLVPIFTNGVDAERYRGVEIGSGPIGRSVESGEIFLVGRGGASQPPADEPNLTACIPLKLEHEVIGAIAVFRLLPQKPALEDLDYELFDLLATHAATALYCAGLHARVAGARAAAS